MYGARARLLDYATEKRVKRWTLGPSKESRSLLTYFGAISRPKSEQLRMQGKSSHPKSTPSRRDDRGSEENLSETPNTSHECSHCRETALNFCCTRGISVVRAAIFCNTVGARRFFSIPGMEINHESSNIYRVSTQRVFCSPRLGDS